MKRQAGIISLKLESELIHAKGSFKWNLGLPKREVIQAESGKVVGYKETPQPSKLEGDIIVTDETDLKKIKNFNGTVTCELANGKTFVLRDAIECGDSDVDTGEATMSVMFSGVDADLI